MKIQECYCCKKKVDKLYEHKGWKICWDCYWKDVDENSDKDSGLGGK